MLVDRREILLNEARRLRKAAEKATSQEARDGLLEIADTYTKLAEQASAAGVNVLSIVKSS